MNCFKKAGEAASRSSKMFFRSLLLMLALVLGASEMMAQTRQPIITVPTGRFCISPYKVIGLNIDVVNGSSASGALLQVYNGSFNNEAQKFEVEYHYDGGGTKGYYTIMNVASKKYISLQNGNAGVRIAQFDRNDNDEKQHWIIDKATSEGMHFIKNCAYPGLVMDMYIPSGGDPTSGTGLMSSASLEGYTTSSALDQWWVFKPVDDKQQMPDGYYQLRSGNSDNFKFCISVDGNSTASGANLHLWKSSENHTAMAWKVEYIGDGYYTLTNKNSDRVVYVQGNDWKGIPNIIQNTVDNSEACKFVLRDAGDGRWFIVNPRGKFIDNQNATYVDGNNIVGFRATSNAAQTWYLVATLGEKVIDNGCYFIHSAIDDNYVLDVSGESKDAGANVFIWSKTGGDNQKWHVQFLGTDPAGYGYYSLVSGHAHMALDVHNGSQKKGSNVQQYSNSAATNDAQQWIIRETKPGSGKYYIINKNGLFLDIAGGKMEDGTNIQGWTGNRSEAQEWTFERYDYGDESALNPAEKPTITCDYSGKTLCNHTCTVTINDNCDVEHFYYSVDGGATWIEVDRSQVTVSGDWHTWTYTLPIPTDASKEGWYSFKAVDFTGNETIVTHVVEMYQDHNYGDLRVAKDPDASNPGWLRTHKPCTHGTDGSQCGHIKDIKDNCDYSPEEIEEKFGDLDLPAGSVLVKTQDGGVEYTKAGKPTVNEVFQFVADNKDNVKGKDVKFAKLTTFSDISTEDGGHEMVNPGDKKILFDLNGKGFTVDGVAYTTGSGITGRENVTLWLKDGQNHKGEYGTDDIPYANESKVTGSPIKNTRKFSATQNDHWQAVYLPFEANVPEGYQVGVLKSVKLEGTTATVVISKWDVGTDKTLQPFTAYFIKAKETSISDVEFKDVNEVLQGYSVENIAEKSLGGGYTYAGSLKSSDCESGAEKNMWVMTNGGAFKWMNVGQVQRPYRWVVLGTPTPGQTSAPQLLLAEEDEETAITDIQIIEEDADIYSLSGVKMPKGTKLPSGVYIANGKKFYVK